MRTLQFIRPLGAGAFGTVYLAELASGQGFRRPVAVKVIQQHRPDSQMFMSRIRDEARLLGLLQDDAILKVIDMVAIDGMDAVVMEFVEGADLDSLAKAGRRPPPRALAELGASVAGALSRAHEARHPATQEPLNVVHRDVKPANIMVTRSGGVKLLDFGIARARFDARESFTGQLVLGTLNYMAPEYIVTGEVSAAADVFGLALSLWEVAAGEVYGQPKVRQDAHERRLAERLERISDTFGALAPVLERMLQWDAAQRPAAAAVERELLAAADQMTGTGLRRWATDVVGSVLDARIRPEDLAGLSGRTVQIGSAPAVAAPTDSQAPTSFVPVSGVGNAAVPAPDTTAATAGPPPLSDPQPARRNQPEQPIVPTVSSDLTRAAPAPARDPDHRPVATPTADRPPARRPSSRPARPHRGNRGPSVISVIIKGLLIGGSIGFMLVVAVAITFLLIRL